MQSSLLALSLAAAALPMASAYPVKADVLNCRSGPGTSYDVVRQYTQGTEVDIVCQTPGPSVNGDTLWDKTGDGCFVADYYIKTGTADYVAPKCDDGGDGGSDGGDNLPGLDAVQTRNARAIIGEASNEGVGRQGCLAVVATALVESNIRVLANENVPESLNYPHDGVGSDHDSVGIFQQRAIYYPDIAADMDPARSAAQFLAKMKSISGWQTMDVGQLCQKVQVSAYPERYGQRVPEATEICEAAGM
ncbi:hypothetical protein VTH82DRAFT_6570 [Thermothelomyces myriococcoides]